MLQLCSDGHEDCVHDGTCPACAALAKVNETEGLYSVAQTQVDELKQALVEAETTRDGWKDEALKYENRAIKLQSELDHLHAKLDNA